MNTYANKDLRMPAHYVDMSEKEMEYDGGFPWSFALIGASLALTAIGHATGNRNVNRIGTLVGVLGIMSTGYGAVALATAAAPTTYAGAALVAGMTSDALTIGSWIGTGTGF